MPVTGGRLLPEGVHSSAVPATFSAAIRSVPVPVVERLSDECNLILVSVRAHQIEAVLESITGKIQVMMRKLASMSTPTVPRASTLLREVPEGFLVPVFSRLALLLDGLRADNRPALPVPALDAASFTAALANSQSRQGDNHLGR